MVVMMMVSGLSTLIPLMMKSEETMSVHPRHLRGRRPPQSTWDSLIPSFGASGTWYYFHSPFHFLLLG